MGTERILIVSHVFPPRAGIGGRRWAKFAKYLHRSGAKVRVLCADLPISRPSAWSADVSGIDVQTYPHRFPRILLGRPRSVLAKLRYRLALAYAKIRSKGTPYDRGFMDRWVYQAALEQAIRAFSPHAVIISGGPFSLLYNALPLVKKHPEVIFIGDFRDPWSWALIYGYDTLRGSRKRFEEKMEGRVVEKFSMLLSPSEEISKTLTEKYPDYQSKISTLPHAYDLDDIIPRSEKNDSQNKISIIYGGTIYDNVVDHLRILSDFVAVNSEKVQLNIYSNDHPEDQEFKSVYFHHTIGSKQFFEKVATADWQLLLIPIQVKDDVLTKLFELAATGVPILMMGHRGRLSEFVEKNKIGFFAESAADLKEHLFSGFDFSTDLDWLEQRRYDRITDQLMTKIKSELSADAAA